MCFNLATLEQLLIWLVVIVAIISILKLLLPWVLGQLGMAGGMVSAIINIAVWAIITIIVIQFAFIVIGCLGGLHLPSIGH